MRKLLAGALFLVMSSTSLIAAELPTGPAVGDSVPQFEAVDQNGEKQTLESLAGPNGLLLLVHRSADW